MSVEFKKILGIQCVIFVLAFLLVNPVSSQTKKEENISFYGVIESVSEDLKFIVVNEAKIFISSSTRISDDMGNILKINDLKPKGHVAIEALRNQEKILAKKIVVKTSKGKQ